MKKRKLHLKQLREMDKIKEDQDKNKVKDPEKLLKLNQMLEKDNRRLTLKVEEYTTELTEAKQQIEELTHENRKLKKELEYEKIGREQDLGKAIKKHLKGLQDVIDSFKEESSVTLTETKELKKNLGDMQKQTKKLAKDANEILANTKQLVPNLDKLNIIMTKDSNVGSETRGDVVQIKKCLFAIQKENIELKNALREMADRLQNADFGQSSGGDIATSPRGAPYNFGRLSKLEDSHDNDFYMDDDLRQKAEEYNKQKTTVKPVETPPEIERIDVEVYNEAADQNHAIEMQEITHLDLQNIVKEYLDEEVVVDEEFELIIDWSNKQHQVLLEFLTSKILPRLNAISLRNMESEQEVVAKFLYLSLQNGVDTLTLNEYCSGKISITYYIISIQHLLINKLVGSTLTLRDVEVPAQIFTLLLNTACTCPISLEIGWANIQDLNELKIDVSQEDLQLQGLEISYSELGDEGTQLIVEELIRCGLVHKLSEINLQGNNTEQYNYKKVLSEYPIDIEG